MFLALLAVPLAAAAPPQSPFVRPPVRVDAANPGPAESCAADLDQRLAAVVWIDASAGGEHLWCARSLDGGQSFEPRVAVDADPSGADKSLRGRSLRVADGAVYACWIDRRNGLPDAYFRASRDGGVTWEPEIRLDDGAPPGAAAVEFLELAVDDGTGLVAVLVQIDGAPAGDELRLARSIDTGLSFQPSVLLHAGGTVGRADLDRDGATLHVVWQDDATLPGFLDLHYQRSTDSGASWLPAPLELSQGFTTDPSDLRIEADGARVAVVFQEISALCSIAIFASHDGGASWLPWPRRVAGSVSPACVPQNPRLLFTPSYLVVAWADDRATPGVRTPWLAWTGDEGATWTEHALSAAPGWAPRLRGDAARGTFAVQWHADTQLDAAVSRAATPEPGPAFAVDGGLAIEHADLRRDAPYDDLLSVWIERDPASLAGHVWAAGFRAANLIPNGQFQAGGTVAFQIAGFPHDQSGWKFQVAAALGLGTAALPFGDGRSLGLAVDPLLLASAGQPSLRGVVLAGGGGATPSFPFPAAIPPGTALRLAAVAFATGPPRFGAITDVRTVIVQ